MGHYVRLALFPGNRHGPMHVDMVIISRNNNFFVFVVTIMRRTRDTDVVIVARNIHFLESVVVVAVVDVVAMVVVVW